ncbi:MAG TPA: fused MFS/spermidine synthase [Candidatus Didemnitutus sp.]|nr:fused MFS/spermidine synthase [Candidatus Didemnitutus sp.]
MSDPTGRRDPSRLLPFLLLVSGFIGTLYEVLWQRECALLFGSATSATAVVLGAFFAGLGIGAWLGGRWADWIRRPLLAYAMLEGVIGLGALSTGPILHAFGTFSVARGFSATESPGALLTTKALWAFGALLIPTAAMGATLPVLGTFADGGRGRLGLSAGWLYVVNTAGAAFGALAAPFLALPFLGLRGAIAMGAGINVAIGAGAVLLDRARATVAPRSDVSPASPRPAKPESAGGILIAAFMSGAATFALQVEWNRAFAQIHENSTQSFALVVAAVIVALAIGGQGARWALRAGLEPRELLGWAWLAGGAAVVFAPVCFVSITQDLEYLSRDASWTHELARLARLALIFVVPTMALLGLALPAIMELAGRRADAKAGRALGQVFTANIAGSVVGALAGGLILPGMLGLWRSMMTVGIVVATTGLISSWTGSFGRIRRILSAGAATVIVATGVMLARDEAPRVSVDAGADERLVSVSEGTHGIVAVVERPGSRRLKLNNHYGLGGTASTGDERMQAHIPLLLHPHPQRVAFLGLGTGITAGGATFHPVASITVVELVPEVAAAARTAFDAANHHLLSDVRTRLIGDDARNFLRGTPEKFDVIVGDLVVPWRPGEAALFTAENFSAAHRALAGGGLYCQWLPLHQLSETEVAIIARTFLAEFPEVQVWRGDFSPTEPAIALVGSDTPLDPDDASWDARAREVRDRSNPQLVSREIFWMGFVGTLAVTDLPADETRTNTEERPWIELLGPRVRSGAGPDALLTGRRLQAWLDRLRENSAARERNRPPMREAAVTAGGVLGEFTLCLQEDNAAGARAAQEHLRRMLSPEAYNRLFP